MHTTHTVITNEDEIKQIIRAAWSSDKDFFKEYSVYDSMEESINDTTARVLSFMQAYEGCFISLNNTSGEIIGYLVISVSMRILFSFAMVKAHRTKENKSKFINVIEELFGPGQIAVSLYKKNIRSLNFFKQNGYEEQECVTLIKTIS